MGVGTKRSLGTKVHQMMQERKSFKASEIIRNGSMKESTSLITRSNSLPRVGESEGIISELSMKKKEEQIIEIVVTIDRNLQASLSKNSASRSRKICRVPNNLRELHKQGFDPKVVSIGPFHRQCPDLQSMEEHKLRFLSYILNSMYHHQDHNQNFTFTTEVLPQSAVTQQGEITAKNADALRCLVVAMMDLEDIARACYAEAFDKIDSKEFVQMMLLDGCFVVELLRLYAKSEKENVDDPIFTSRWMVPNLQHDLLMFENQLPYTVIEKIFDITNLGKEGYSVKDLTLKFFDSLLPRKKALLDKCIVDKKPHHLLGLFRSSFLSSFKSDRTTSSVRQADRRRKQMMENKELSIPIQERQLIHCATELMEAGIVFKIRDNHDLLDIEFKNGNLYIPPLLVDDQTGPVFLNFVAYEQCYRHSEPYFTHYLLFLDSLVNSSKDVEHLHYIGIIDHVLGCDEDVANLINKLCKEVVHDVDNCYLSEPLKAVNRYFRMKRHKWWAKWKHDYFSNPWAFSSFLAAICLLILTFIQTFFSVFSYILPPS